MAEIALSIISEPFQCRFEFQFPVGVYLVNLAFACLTPWKEIYRVLTIFELCN
jgi:hypothetical protein